MSNECQNVVVLTSKFRVDTVPKCMEYYVGNEEDVSTVASYRKEDGVLPKFKEKIKTFPIERVNFITESRFGRTVTEEAYVVDDKIKEYAERVYGSKVKNLEATVEYLTHDNNRLNKALEDEKHLHNWCKVTSRKFGEDLIRYQHFIKTGSLWKLVVILFKVRFMKKKLEL